MNMIIALPFKQCYLMGCCLNLFIVLKPKVNVLQRYVSLYRVEKLIDVFKITQFFFPNNLNRY